MTGSHETPAAEELVQETLRLYRRYQLELVEALNLCPWAKRARLDGHVDVSVSLQTTQTFDGPLGEIDRWTDTPEIEIALLIFPCIGLGRRDFERFVAALVQADHARMHLSSPAFAMAAFHPDAEADAATAERLIPYLRRTPDPTIQLVRVSALERVRQGDTGGTAFFDPSQLDLTDPASFRKLQTGSQPSLRERVASANLDTARTLGFDQMERRFQDILQDHALSRARLSQRHEAAPNVEPAGPTPTLPEPER